MSAPVAEHPVSPAAPATSSPASRQVTILRPSTRWKAVNLAELWRYRDLLLVLSMREIQVRYKQTILGVFWAIIQPLATTGIFAVLFGLLMGRGNEPGTEKVPYFISTFCAMLPWQLFANSIAQAGNSLVANQRLITKVYFPRLIIPLSAVLGALADFVIALVALFIIMICYGVKPSPAILALPLFIALAIMASVAVGLWLSAATALYRDFRHMIPFIVQIGLFLSPVIYTTQSLRGKLPDWALTLYGLNPMAGVIEGFRWAMLPNAQPPNAMILVSALMTIVLLIGGAFYFRAMEKWFADLV
jgi:lipopolysaccharide transport system permease protein